MEGFSDGSSTLPASTKTKGHPKGCPFVLGSDRRRRSPPFGDSNARDGRAIPPPRFCLRQNARTPQKRRGPEGPLGNISRWRIENLKYLDFWIVVLCHKKGHDLRRVLFCGLRGPKARFALQDQNAQGGKSAPPPRFSPAAKFLYGALAPPARWPPIPFQDFKLSILTGPT